MHILRNYTEYTADNVVIRHTSAEILRIKFLSVMDQNFF